MTRTIGEHAVVIGAGIAGLAAARVLRDSFRAVTVVERDDLDGESRTGAPQANHSHVLLALGVDLLEKMYPGITREMEESGVGAMDFARDLCWLQYGGWLPRTASPMVVYPQTRYSLEGHIRRRLVALGNVEILSAVTVKSLCASADRKRVTGVEIALKGGETRELPADVVVDAGGRGSPLVKWLQQMGYDAPAETSLPIDLCYVSRIYERPDSPRKWRGLWVSPVTPEIPRGGALMEIEGNRWVVSVFGYHGDHPPRDEQGFLEFTQRFVHPSFYETIRDAKPVSGFSVYRVPNERWRHLEQLKRFPDGLLAIGDTFCYFDPVFGQGMSMAMMQADLLRKRLARTSSATVITSSWALSYFRTCAAMIRGVWYFVWAEALRHPKMPGPRPALARALQWMVLELYDLCRSHPKVYLTFLPLMHLRSSPVVLLHPRISLRLAMRAVRQSVFRRPPLRAAIGDVPG